MKQKELYPSRNIHFPKVRMDANSAGFGFRQQQAGGMFKQMARIAIAPEWVKIMDFETRFPSAIEKAAG